MTGDYLEREREDDSFSRNRSYPDLADDGIGTILGDIKAYCSIYIRNYIHKGDIAGVCADADSNYVKAIHNKSIDSCWIFGAGELTRKVLSPFSSYVINCNLFVVTRGMFQVLARGLSLRFGASRLRCLFRVFYRQGPLNNPRSDLRSEVSIDLV